MKIVVIGGSGLIGKNLVGKLRQAGHEAVAASPSTGVDSVTGVGLEQGLEGAQVLVDVSNSPSFEDKAVLDFFETSGRNLIAAAKRAHVRHYVALSVVGTERLLGSGYFRAKMAQEELIKASAIPYTILRATQFFEFLGAIAQSSTQGAQVHLSPALVQPMAAEDVASALADVVLAAPANATLEVAGPEKKPLAELIRRYLSANGKSPEIRVDAEAPYFGIRLDDRSLTPDDGARLMPTRFEQWLARSAAGTR